MIEKITLQLNENGQFCPENGRGCENLNPKELLLHAGAQCAGLTVMMIMKKENFCPKRFEISLSGDLSTDTVQPQSVFRSFHVVYNVECATAAEQVKASRAVTLAHEKYCGMMQMLRRIAPLSQEIAIVSTEPANV